MVESFISQSAPPVLPLNVQLNIRSSFGLVTEVINNISMKFEMFLHTFLIVDENTFLQILRYSFSKRNLFQLLSGSTQTLCFLFRKNFFQAMPLNGPSKF